MQSLRDPIQRFSTGRAKLSFYRAMSTPAGDEPYAMFNDDCRFLSPEDQRHCNVPKARITVQAPTPGYYIVECSLLSISSASDVWIVNVGNDEAKMAVNPYDEDHVVFVVEAGAPGDYTASLTTTAQAWALYSCSVNRAS